MQLFKMDYVQYQGLPEEWRIIDCTFGPINLIVGKNASGKTRTLNVIANLAKQFYGDSKLRFGEGDFHMTFEGDDKPIQYWLEYHKKRVVKERLKIGGETVLDRGATGEGKIWAEAEELKRLIRFQTATDEVAANARRDLVQHPFLEPLHRWGSNLQHYRFGTPLEQDKVVLLVKNGTESQNDSPRSSDEPQQVFDAFRKGEREYPTRFISALVDDMNRIGYQIENVVFRELPGVTTNVSLPTPPSGLAVKETDLPEFTFQPEISQGMWRALSILIHLNYLSLAGTSSCILIDDIGEGLDYERSTGLVKLLVDKATTSSVQLVMTTNDRFIMNAVPLEYWVILQRDGGKVTHYNYRNSKSLFDEFRLTGLSNFDMLSSRYYLKGKNGG